MIVRTLSLAEFEPDSAALHSMFVRAFGSVKAEFLARHGNWLSHGASNRWVVLVDEVLAGYCAVIPTVVALGNRNVEACWWIDLFILPEFRGLGIQTRFDELVAAQGALTLGFPNAIAASIHRKHGWWVGSPLKVFVAVTHPAKVRQTRHGGWVSCIAKRTACEVFSIAQAAVRQTVRLSARSVSDDEEAARRNFAQIYQRRKPMDAWQTFRESEYLEWRYFDNQTALSQSYFTISKDTVPVVAIVMRAIDDPQGGFARILDVFGDLADVDSVATGLRSARAMASHRSLGYVVAFSAQPSLDRALVHAGFFPVKRTMLCARSDDAALLRLFAERAHHWVIGDSDNDEPA